MRRSLVTLALALPGLIITGCDGNTASGSAVAPLPNAAVSAYQSRARTLDNGPQDLHAGGADFPGYAYNLDVQPVGSYNQVQPRAGQGSLFYAAPTKGTIYYCLNSSGDGRKAFEGSGDSQFPPTGPCAALGSAPTGFGGRQDPLDFVGTSVALPSTECCGTSTPYYQNRDEGSQTWGQPFEIPQIGGLISFPYRTADFSANVSHLSFSTWTYCAIANGAVNDWNDPAITADNGTSVTGGVSEPITFYFRSDSSGTTYNFVNHLNTVCNRTWRKPYNRPPYESSGRSAAWTFGVNSTWPGPGSSSDPNPNFIGEAGAPLLLNEVQETAYSTGYLEGSYAEEVSQIGQAFLQNGYNTTLHQATFINPTKHAGLVAAFSGITSANIQYGQGSDGNPLGSNTPWCQLYIPPSAFVAPRVGAYPIVAVSYLLFYGKNNGVHVADKETLIKYLESKSANEREANFEYTAMTSSVETAVLTALNGTSSQTACLQ